MSDGKRKFTDEDLKKVIRTELKSQLKGDMSEWEEEINRPKSRRLIPKFAWAAGFLLIISFAGLLFFNRQPNKTNAELYEAFMQPPNLITAPIVRGQKDTETEFWQAYQQGRYEQQSKAYASLPDSLKQQEEFLFYQSIAWMKTQQWTQVIPALERISTQGILLKEEAQWFLALTHLNQEQVDQAKITLDSIQQQKKHRYQKQAKQLLNSFSKRRK